MPLLKKSNTKLLRTVAGKQHATNDDHIDDSTSSSSPRAVPTKDANHEVAATLDELEDYMRSPESSEDEVSEVIRPPSRVPDLQILSTYSTTSATFNQTNANGNGNGKEHSRGTKGGNRKREADDSDDGKPLFSSLQNPRSSGSLPSKSQSKRMTYGTQNQTRSSQLGREKDKQSQSLDKRKGFKATKALTPEKKAPATAPATFKTVEDAAMFQFRGAISASPQSRSASILVDDTPPSSPEVIDCTEVGSGAMKVRCEACNQKVDLLLKQEYEDEFAHGVALSIARQNAFCRYHMRHDAQQEWKKEGYPERIDWHGLDVRIQRQHDHLRAVLQRKMDSSFRSALEHHVASRAKRKKGLENDLQTAEVLAGYYGPRGQKVIINHIVTHLGSALRASTDPLILAAGRSAGVSGYVQQVLVPEVALALIMEDHQHVDKKAALSILSKSQRVGELLNDDDGDVVTLADRS